MTQNSAQRWPTTADVAAAVERAKAEVLEDIDAGTLPATVRTFPDLHDHVDANLYGGLCDDDGPIDWIGADQANGYMYGNAVQGAVDAWLRERAARQYGTPADSDEPCAACNRPAAEANRAHWGGVGGAVIVAWTCSPECTDRYRADRERAGVELGVVNMQRVRVQ